MPEHNPQDFFDRGQWLKGSAIIARQSPGLSVDDFMARIASMMSITVIRRLRCKQASLVAARRAAAEFAVNRLISDKTIKIEDGVVVVLINGQSGNGDNKYAQMISYARENTSADRSQMIEFAVSVGISLNTARCYATRIMRRPEFSDRKEART